MYDQGWEPRGRLRTEERGEMPTSRPSAPEDFCAVQASPELAARLRAQLGSDTGRTAAGGALPVALTMPRRLGFNDGVILPPSAFPPGTSARRVRHAAADRAPLRGTVRVVVVLVEFSDKTFEEGQPERFRDLFFSTAWCPPAA